MTFCGCINFSAPDSSHPYCMLPQLGSISSITITIFRQLAAEILPSPIPHNEARKLVNQKPVAESGFAGMHLCMILKKLIQSIRPELSQSTSRNKSSTCRNIRRPRNVQKIDTLVLISNLHSMKSVSFFSFRSRALGAHLCFRHGWTSLGHACPEILHCNEPTATYIKCLESAPHPIQIIYLSKDW
jgi:hypothetical protein